MNTPARRFIMLVIAIVAVAAVVMAPRRNEWVAIMRDGDQQAKIIALLEPQLDRNPDDPDLLATLGRSHAEIGDYQRATVLLERYIVLRPDDGEAYARLADLYNRAGDQDRRLALLRQSLALTPRLSRAMELAGLYRDRQQTDEELALLSRYESELTLESGLLLRVATLYAAHGDRERALHVLMRPEVLATPTRPLRSQDERLYLAALLIEAGQSEQALRLGLQWIAQWHEPWLADRLLRVFAVNAPLPQASQLAEAVAVLHPEVRFFLANGLVKLGAGPVARHLLVTWSKANPAPSANEIAAFLSACRAQDEPGIVWQAFAGTLARQAPNDIIARYSEAIVAEFGIGALAPFWTNLPRPVIEGRPLLAARLAFHEGDPALAKALLDRVELRGLTAPDRRMWIDLLTAIASPREVFAALRDRRSRGDLPTDLMTEYARSAGAFGQEVEYRAALGDLRRMDPDEARHGIR